MRNTITWASVVCLCACLLGSAGCESWDWQPSWSQKDQPDLADQPPAAEQESPEQKTIRRQGETIEQLTAKNRQHEDDILKLANFVNDLRDQNQELKFALDKQMVVNKSLSDAMDERDRYRAQTNELTDKNRQLTEQIELLKAEIDALTETVNDLNEQNKKLLEGLSEQHPSAGGDEEDGQTDHDNQDD